MCLGFWGGKPRLALTQRRSPLSRCPALPSHPSFLSLSHGVPPPPCARYFKPYLVSSGSPRLLQARAPARAPLSPDGHPGPREVAAEPRAFSSWAAGPCAQRALPGVQAELLGQDLVPRFPGPPASVPGCRGRAAWDAEAPEPFGGHRGAVVRLSLTRGAPGRPRWSQARRWRIFGAHCAA